MAAILLFSLRRVQRPKLIYRLSRVCAFIIDNKTLLRPMSKARLPHRDVAPVDSPQKKIPLNINHLSLTDVIA